MTPKEFIIWMIEENEGGYQDWSDDSANRYHGRMVGTNKGVTPYDLHLMGWPDSRINRRNMKKISMEVAYEVFYKKYYEKYGYSKLEWCPATAHLLDAGVNCGPRKCIKWGQRLCGADVDGIVGPQTIRMYKEWLDRVGSDAAVDAVADRRRRYYRAIIRHNRRLRRFRKGWLARTARLDSDSKIVRNWK